MNDINDIATFRQALLTLDAALCSSYGAESVAYDLLDNKRRTKDDKKFMMRNLIQIRLLAYRAIQAHEFAYGKLTPPNS
jgi:hypothetical protein